MNGINKIRLTRMILTLPHSRVGHLTARPLPTGRGCAISAIIVFVEAVGVAPLPATSRRQPVTVLARNQQTVDMLAQGQCPRLPDCAPIAPLAAFTDHTCLATATIIFVAVPVERTPEF